jgi:hypothetical protein
LEFGGKKNKAKEELAAIAFKLPIKIAKVTIVFWFNTLIKDMLFLLYVIRGCVR